MAGIAEALRRELAAPDGAFAEGYADSFLNTYIAAQIKAIRQQRQMTQEDLAKRLGTTQTAVSRIENVNYAGWNIATLKKIAYALELRLKVSFEEYGTLPEEIEGFSKDALMRAKRTEDPRLTKQSAKAAASSVSNPGLVQEYVNSSHIDFDELNGLDGNRADRAVQWPQPAGQRKSCAKASDEASKLLMDKAA